MHRGLKITGGLFGLLLMLVGCTHGAASDSGSSDIPVVNGASISFAGYYSDGVKTIPRYWTGTASKDLTGDGTHDAKAFSPTVTTSAGTIYTVGYYDNGTITVPCFWTVTSAGTLTRYDLNQGGDTTNSAYALAIAISGSNVYAVGYYTSSGSDKPCLWTATPSLASSNPVRTDLNNGTSLGYALAVAVSGTTVYAAGYYNDGTKNSACYWTVDSSNTQTNLPVTGATSSVATSIVLSSGFLYAGGWYNNGTTQIPTFWTSDLSLSPAAPTNTDFAGFDSSHTASIYAMTMFGSTLYFAGSYYDGSLTHPAYWVQGTASPTDLGDGTHNGEAFAIAVSDVHVYTAGYYTDTVAIPSYWTDSTRTALAGDGTHEAKVISAWQKFQ